MSNQRRCIRYGLPLSTLVKAGIVYILLVAGSAYSHGGGLNSSGCHHNRKIGGYHCHGISYTGNRQHGTFGYFEGLYPRTLGGSSTGAPVVPSPAPLRTICSSSGCTLTNIEITEPERQTPQGSQTKTGKISETTTSSDNPEKVDSGQKMSDSRSYGDGGPGTGIANEQSTKSSPKPPKPLTAINSQSKAEKHSNIKLILENKEALSLVASGGTISGIITFHRCRSAQRKRKTRRVTQAINKELRSGKSLIYRCDKQVLAVSAAKSIGEDLELRATQLDYSTEDSLGTEIRSHEVSIPAALLVVKGGLGRSRSLPKALPINGQWFWALDSSTQHGNLVNYHHKVWLMLDRMHTFELQLREQLDKLEFEGRKYRDSIAMPHARKALQVITEQKHEQLEQICACRPKLEQTLSMLTLQIESIEDFGGILLDSGISDDYGQNSLSEQSRILTDEIREQCAYLQDQLDAYQELMNIPR